MSKLRLLFVKEGPAAYISNLDLLRTVQRAFPRTELDIKHSQGFHPHPIISIVLPLPVCQSSDCELLDFEVTQDTDGAGLAEKLNGGLPEGLRILDCYPALRPVRELAYLRAEVELDYDRGPKAAPAKKTAPAKKEETKAAAPAKKATAKKAAPAKTTENVFVEFAGGQIKMAAIVAKVKEVIGNKTVKELNVYYQPETGMVYYTADGESGSYSL